jgi:hypothetical protein
MGCPESAVRKGRRRRLQGWALRSTPVPECWWLTVAGFGLLLVVLAVQYLRRVPQPAWRHCGPTGSVQPAVPRWMPGRARDRKIRSLK